MIPSTMTSMRKLVLAAAAAVALTAPLGAQGSITSPRTSSVGTLTGGTGGVRSIGQSFTVTTIGAQLSSFSLSMTSAFDGANLRFSAYVYRFDASSRTLTGPAAWSLTALTGSGNEFGFDTRTFNTGNVLLTPGATYMFLLTTVNDAVVFPDAGVLLGASDADVYTGGAVWTSDATTAASLGTTAWTQVNGPADLAFTATFVPEPATVVLTGTGLLALAGVARRRARRA